MSDDNEAQGQNPLDDAEDEDSDALFDRIKTWHKLSRNHLAEWREQAREDYGFVAGDQWTTEDLEKLRDQKRPPVTFNRIGPVVDSVAGMEVGNRQEVKYLPRQVENSGFNEMLSNAAKFFRDESEAEDEESDAFFDVIVCGLGATETRPDFDEDPDGLVPTDRLDPLSLWYDPTARKRNLTDRRYCGYDKELSLDDAKAQFPDVEDEDDLDAGWARSSLEDTSPHDATPQLAYNQGDQGDKNKNAQAKRVLIVYCEWWDREEYHLAVNPFNGQKIEMDTATAKALNRRVGQIKKAASKFGIEIPPQMQDFKTVQLNRKVFKSAFVGKRVLKSGPGRCPHDFTVNFITGKRDRNENTFYGLVRAMKDPQRWANKFFSQIMHVINSNAKGGIIAESDAFVNQRKAEDDWARSDAVIWATPGAIGKGKIKDRPPITYPAGLDKMMEYSISAIRDTTGVNLEMLGMADREQAGVLEYQRKKAGIAILGTLFDSLRRYRKQQGRALLYIIQNYIPEQRLIRIDTENGPQYAPLLKDPSNTQYDVIVDDAPTSPDQKEAVWGMVSQMMPFLTKLQIPMSIWGEIVKYSPLPNSLATKFAQAINQPQQPQIPPQVQEHIEQLTDQLTDLQKQLQQAEMDKAQLKMQGQAKVVEAQGTMQIEAARVMHQQELDQRQMELKEAIAQKEMEIQRQRAELEIQIKDAETAANLKRKQREAEFDEARERQQMELQRENEDRKHEFEKDKFAKSHSLEREKAQVDEVKKGPRKKTVKMKKTNGKTTGAEVTGDDGSVLHIEIA